MEPSFDSRRAWLVTFGAFMISAVVDGISFSFGILFTELLEYFGESKSLTAWVISVYGGTYRIVGPIASVLVSRYGNRCVTISGAVITCIGFFCCTWSRDVQTMIILYGLVGGFGMGMAYLSALVTVGHCFEKKRALATGIAVCGSGVGGFVMAPLLEYLLYKYSWKGAMWIISGISLNCAVMGALFCPIKVVDKHGSATEENSKCCDVSKTLSACASMFEISLLRRFTFLEYSFSCFLCLISFVYFVLIRGPDIRWAFTGPLVLWFYLLSLQLLLRRVAAGKMSPYIIPGFHIPYNFIPDHIKRVGMTSEQGVALISISSISNCVSRVVVGWIGDRSWSDNIMLNGCVLILGGASTIFVEWYNSFGLMISYSIVIGCVIGTFVSLKTPILTELLGIENLTTSYGFLHMFIGIASFIGSPLAGLIADRTGRYSETFYFAGTTLVLAGLFCLPLRRISQWETNVLTDTTKDICVSTIDESTDL